MAMQNPFADLIPQGVPSQSPIVAGTPRPPAPPAPPSGYREVPGGYEAVPGGPGDPNRPGGPQDPNRDPSVEQGKSAGFLRRAARANNLYLRQNVGAPSIPQQVGTDRAPIIANQYLSPAMRQARASQDEFIAATLRYESGAAIPPSELEAQRQRYFPVPGDDPGTIRLKAKLRQTALEGLQLSAGPRGESARAVDEVEDVRAAVQAAQIERGIRPQGFSADQAQLYDRWLAANQNATADQLRQFGQSLGVSIDNADEIIAARGRGAGVAPGSSAITSGQTGTGVSWRVVGQ